MPIHVVFVISLENGCPCPSKVSKYHFLVDHKNWIQAWNFLYNIHNANCGLFMDIALVKGQGSV